jgi:negative regulator of sigma-B (phosphoserine phosphatase)
VNATVAHVSIPKVGEHMNGDAVLVRRSASGDLLLAVLDGLGHGPNAAKASQLAITWLQTADLTQPLSTIMQAVHAQLRETRGAAGTLCIVRGERLEGCAVGNVQFSCMNATVPMVLSAGVLGQRLPKLRVCEAVLRPGARIALFSDGISSKFRLDESRQLRPQQACEVTIERHRKKEDDATILIADLEA